MSVSEKIENLLCLLENRPPRMSTPASGEVTVLKNFINNEFYEPTTKEYLDNLNPARNELLSKVPKSCDKDVDSAVEAARKAQPTWEALGAKGRSKWLNLIADTIALKIEKLAMLESTDNGKPYTLAKSVDIPRAIDNFRFFANLILYDETECHQMIDALNYTQRHAIGVIGLITPWNLPLYLLTWKIAPAIACGILFVFFFSFFLFLFCDFAWHKQTHKI